jgi:hypothetical protein
MTGSEKVAVKIAEMLKLRAEGKLKKSADDFVSGLCAAYALINNLPAGVDTVSLALAEANQALTSAS